MALPIDCRLGETCYIQNYADADPGAGVTDFTCGGLSYDGHKGTDFALPSLAAMRAGVRVLAAAPGQVRATRDGEPDRLFTAEDAARIDGKECGNGVVIAHGDGWETQYCHMAQGSIRVSQGALVDTGTPLGRVGLSGRTQFPHLHLSLRHNGQVIDPFAPNAEPGQCGLRDGASLWRDAPAYQPGGLLSVGFADALPDYDTIKAGTAGHLTLPADAPALVLWAYAYGAQAGDVLRLSITAPNGRGYHQAEVPIEAKQAQYFRASGRRIRKALRPGLYQGQVVLRRNGKDIDTMSVTVQLR
ncbi:M23 family metallopeptidase [Pseudooceanicola sp.]|uniref:M23 family metallopeptidase n=1 Tax=Pseudooceanicola sp. TaxID=1914328 RepID=UPI00342BEC93